MEETQTHIHRGAPRCAHRRVSAVTERAERARARFHLRKARTPRLANVPMGSVCVHEREEMVFFYNLLDSLLYVCVRWRSLDARSARLIYTRARSLGVKLLGAPFGYCGSVATRGRRIIVIKVKAIDDGCRSESISR